MPLTLVPPRKGRSRFYRVRGTYLGRYIDRTAETADKDAAKRFLKSIRGQIERGQLADKAELSFADAALSYVKAGGERRFLVPIIDYFAREFGDKFPAGGVTQAILDEAATKIYPHGTAGTRNRQFYTPVSAILRHAGIERIMRRPKGAQGKARTRFPTPDEMKRLIVAAREVDAEFAVFLAWLLYTGLRLSEGLRVQCRAVDLSRGFAHVEITKNQEPRAIHLPPPLVAELANHPRGLDRVGRVFRFTKSGSLYDLMRETKHGRKDDDGNVITKGAGADLGWITFHYLRHAYGAWMRRGGADLVATKAWASRAAAARYEHADTSEEARKADFLPNVTGRA